VKRLSFACLVGAALLSAPCGAQTFSVAFLEDARGLEAPEFSNAVLGGSLDALFGSGLIATNETIRRADQTVFRSLDYGIASAREGLVDYLAILWIRYGASGAVPPAPVPEEVMWRLVRVRDGAVLGDGAGQAPSGEGNSGEGSINEMSKIMREFGESLADLWLLLLAKDRGGASAGEE
jgi:hypothetical protein